MKGRRTKEKIKKFIEREKEYKESCERKKMEETEK